MNLLSKDQIRQLIKEGKLQTAEDVQTMLKDLFAETIQEMLEAEMNNQLGYSKHDYKNKHTSNSRNGRSKKTVTSQYGEVDLQIPRDREGEFEPQIVKNALWLLEPCKTQVRRGAEGTACGQAHGRCSSWQGHMVLQ